MAVHGYNDTCSFSQYGPARLFPVQRPVFCHPEVRCEWMPGRKYSIHPVNNRHSYPALHPQIASKFLCPISRSPSFASTQAGKYQPRKEEIPNPVWQVSRFITLCPCILNRLALCSLHFLIPFVTQGTFALCPVDTSV